MRRQRVACTCKRLNERKSCLAAGRLASGPMAASSIMASAQFEESQFIRLVSLFALEKECERNSNTGRRERARERGENERAKVRACNAGEKKHLHTFGIGALKIGRHSGWLARRPHDCSTPNCLLCLASFFGRKTRKGAWRASERVKRPPLVGHKFRPRSPTHPLTHSACAPIRSADAPRRVG